jgi:type VI secretion system secreted protein VgrG
MPRAIEAIPRAIEIATPLDQDVLLFHRMHAREELSRLSHFEVELLGHPDHGDIDIDKILGQNVTIKLALDDDSNRFFNGFVTRFAQAGRHGRYNRFIASVQPWTWFLTRTSDCRIFQDMTVPDIVKAVFVEHGVTDFRFDLTASYRQWNYCVQYRETDFNFISRLLEHEGIFYYFRHTDGHHTMMLTDSTDMLTATPGYEEIKFFTSEQVLRPKFEHIERWDFAREVQPGRFVHTDYDLTRPSVDLQTQKALPRRYTPSNYEIYDYPGYYSQRRDGEQYAAVRLDEFGTQFETAQAETNARGVAVGSLFTLERCPRADQNREHVIIAATYDLELSEYEAMPTAEGPFHYHCAFVAMSSEQQFRPKRTTPKPFVQGPQTAVVVGPPGEEIYTDEYGRVKVKFHWDRESKEDENSSCWIRVSQAWAGKGWGAFHTPRVGHEVIVDFLEGDPDQPIITGSVYNAANMPPYAVPANATHSGIKSRSSKGGNPNNFNEIRMEDTKGSELFYIQAEKDWRIHVKNNETENVGASISTSAGGAISRSSGGNHSRTAGDSITDKAKNTYTLNTGKGQSLKAGGSYQLLTNEGIHLKTINFVMELIEAGIEGAMASLKGDSKEAVASAKGFCKGDSKAAEALGNKIAAQMSSAFGPAIGAASGEITRICSEGEKGAVKSRAQAEAAGVAAATFVQAVQSDAGPEAVATAFVGMAVAAYQAYADTRKLIDGLMPKIPSIVMWAMKDIQGQALWNVSFESKYRDVSLEAKARDVNIRGKRNVSIEAATKDLNLKASAKNVNLEAAKKDVNIKASDKDVKMTAKKKLNIKAEDDNLVMETGKNMTIKAAKKMQLKCGNASITLLEGGDILIRGKAIKLNATSGAVTVKGTPIKLN